CTATRAASADADVIVHGVRSNDDADEADTALAVIADERRARPAQSIAVLVQSRAHLAGVHDRLRELGLPVNAVEIEPLREQQAAQDLVGLTRALLHPGDRIAWLGVLHAPWCGLGWRDLALLTADLDQRAIWDAIRDPQVTARLSDDARARLEWTVAALD